MPKKALGRGLGALLATPENEISDHHILEIPLSEIEPNPLQPRKTFDPEKLQELADSIREKGLIQPIIVTKVDSKYQIVVGERRWRASQLAERSTITAIIKETLDYDRLEIALVENIQRQDLNSIEEAISYKELIDNLNLTQEQLSERLGKSRTSIANTIRLLKLPEDIQKDIVHEKITEGHGRAILGLKNEYDMFHVRDQIIEQNLSVRDTEKLVQEMISSNGTHKNEELLVVPINTESENEDTISEINQTSTLTHQKFNDLENHLKSFFDTDVKLKFQPNKDQGKIEIKYKNINQLDEILNRMGIQH